MQLNKNEKLLYSNFHRLDFEKLNFWPIAIGMATLLPLRLLWFFTWLVLGVINCKILEIGVTKDKPPSPLRRYLKKVVIRWTGLAGMISFGITNIEAYTEPNWKGRRIVSNHVSPVDILYFMFSSSASFVAKESASKGFIGPIARALKCVFINRSCADERKQAYNAIIQRHKSIENDPLEVPLVIFPEGTTTSGYKMLPFKSGAFASMLPLSPVTLIYECPFFNASFELAPMVIWYPLMMSSPSLVTLRVYKLSDSIPESTQTLDDFINTTYNRMSDCLCSNMKRCHPQSINTRSIPDSSFRGKKSCYNMVCGVGYEFKDE